MKLLAALFLAGLSYTCTQTTFTITDVQQHNTATSCWMAINGNVYDATNYANNHPGGAGQITANCGVDASTVYANIGAHVPAKLATTTGLTVLGALVAATVTPTTATPTTATPTVTPTTATPTTAAATVAPTIAPTTAPTVTPTTATAVTTIAVPTTIAPTTLKPTTLNPILACKNSLAALKAAALACGFDATTTVTVTPTKFPVAAATTAPTAAATTASVAGTLNPNQAAIVAVAQQFVAKVCPNATVCIAKLTAAIQTATKTCWMVWNAQAIEDIIALQNLNTFVQVGCSTDPTTGAFCLPSFFTSAFELDNNNINLFHGYAPLNLLKSGKTISNTVLNAICTPCATKVAAALEGLNAQLSVDTYVMYAAALAAACIKDPTVAAGNQFCLNTLTGTPTTAPPTTAMPSSAVASAVATTAAAGNAATAIANAIAQAGAQQSFAAKLNNDLCTPCFRLELNAIQQASTWATSIAGAIANNANNNLLDAECAVNPVTGQRCVASATAIQNALAWDVPQTCANALKGQVCSPACAQLLQSLITKNGCCVGTFLTALKDSVPALVGMTTATTAAVNAFLTRCNVTAAQLAVCPAAQQPTQTTVAVINLNFAFYLNNTAAVTATLQQDIAATAGVGVNSVTILSVKPLVGNKAGAVIVVASVGGPTNADAAAAAAGVATAVANGGGMPTVATATLAVTDPTNSVFAVSDPVYATSQENAVVLTGATTDAGTTTTTVSIGLIVGVVVGGVVVLALVAFGVYKYLTMQKTASAATAGAAKQTAV